MAGGLQVSGVGGGADTSGDESAFAVPSTSTRIGGSR